MPIVRLSNTCLSFGLKPLLDQAMLQVRKGERVCLLGRNGEGKSSLLQLITGGIVADSGEVWIRPGTRVASLAQEVSTGSDESVLEIIRGGIHAGGADEDWQGELQVDQVIARLHLDRDAAMSSLSGGWRRRVMLGRALVSAPDLLLLDEPTNHLDIDAIIWLEDMMKEFEGALLFVSHDRAFVRRLATRIVELDRGQLKEWPAGYDEYVLQKRAALEVEARHAALFDKKLAQEEAWIRQGVEARRTRNEGRVRALKQLRIQRRERRDRIGEVEFQIQDAERSGKLVAEALNVTQSFGAAPVIENFSTRIMRGDRIGIIGPNGCGKTTLIRLLTGEMQPTSGSIRCGTSLKIAYFDQQREQLDPKASIMDNVAGGADTLMIGGVARHVSGYLRDFLFPPERMQAPVSMLSGGERNRLLLARLFAKPSNLLVMDEPTNDLDAETLDLLEDIVADYAGTLLLVSHDREFLDKVVTSTLVFEAPGRIGEYVGGYSDWLQQRKAPAGADRSSAAVPAPPPASRAKSRKLSYQQRRELQAMPEKIAQLEAEQARLQATVNDPQLFRREPAQAAAALERLAVLARQLEADYSRWDALESLATG